MKIHDYVYLCGRYEQALFTITKLESWDGTRMQTLAKDVLEMRDWFKHHQVLTEMRDKNVD